MSNRAKNKKKRRPRRTVYADEVDPDDLPRHLQLLMDSSARFDEFLDPSKSLDEIAADIEQRVRDSVARIVELAAPYDAFDVLACVHLNEAHHDPETYRETEHEGLASAIELVAICLAARGAREGTLPPVNGLRPRPDEVIDEIVKVARSLCGVGSMLGVVAALGAPDWNLGSLGLRAILREIYLRNVAYPHMEEETIRGLMSDPVIDAACRDVMSCGAADIQTAFDASIALFADGWHARFEALADFMNVLEDERQRYIRLAAQGEPIPDDIDPAVRTQADALFANAWDQAGETVLHDLTTVAAKAGISPEVVQTVWDLTAQDLTPGDPAEGVLAFLRGTNPFRLRPLLRTADGSVAPIHSGLLLPAIREITESHLKDTAGWEPYQQRRGQFLEDQAVTFLTNILPTATVHQGYEYYVPDPDAPSPQTTPREYTKVVEGDALLLIDDVAIVVEAKAGSFTPRARRGDSKRLTDDLRKIVTAASEQADRARDTILGDGGLRLRDDTWFDLSHIREVHTIAVSLDDLSGITTTTARLVEAGLLTAGPLPWPVSFHDLRVISELADRPAEFNLFLRRRTEHDLTLRFLAMDELDLYLHFVNGHLYVEPDPAQVGDALAGPDARPGFARRRKKQPLTIIQSLTDPLDAWYAHQLGERDAVADKPSLKCNPNVAALVDTVTARQEPGWLSIGTTLLDGNEALQRAYGRYGSTVAASTRADGEHHSITTMGGSRADWSYVGVFATVTPSEPRARTLARMTDYISIKKHQMQAARGFVLLFDTNVNLVGTAYDNRIPGPDPALDARVANSGLKPVTAAVTAFKPRSNKRGRVTPKKRSR